VQFDSAQCNDTSHEDPFAIGARDPRFTAVFRVRPSSPPEPSPKHWISTPLPPPPPRAQRFFFGYCEVQLFLRHSTWPTVMCEIAPNIARCASHIPFFPCAAAVMSLWRKQRADWSRT
jgi:hypothetical protein